MQCATNIYNIMYINEAMCKYYMQLNVYKRCNVQLLYAI